MFAPGDFIPGGRARGGSGSGVPCRTLSDLDYPGLWSVNCDISSRWALKTLQYFFESTIPACTESWYSLNGYSRLASYKKSNKGVRLGACRFSPEKKETRDYERSLGHVLTCEDSTTCPRTLWANCPLHQPPGPGDHLVQTHGWPPASSDPIS